jgi:hypothetical protein
VFPLSGVALGGRTSSLKKAGWINVHMPVVQSQPWGSCRRRAGSGEPVSRCGVLLLEQLKAARQVLLDASSDEEDR